jgi:hypothetical protein
MGHVTDYARRYAARGGTVAGSAKPTFEPPRPTARASVAGRFDAGARNLHDRRGRALAGEWAIAIIFAMVETIQVVCTSEEIHELLEKLEEQWRDVQLSPPGLSSLCVS